MRKKFLIIGPSWVGDMMMAQVLFQLLHQHHSPCELHVLAPAWSEALLSRMPEVAKSIVLPFGHGALQLRKRYQFAKQLRSEKYDQAIVLPNSFKSALIPYWANVPVRTGWLGEYRFGLLNDVRYLNKKYFSKMVERFAALAFARNVFQKPSANEGVAALPAPKLQINREDIAATLQQYNLNIEKPILALCPGAEFGPSKCWPAEYYAELANQKLLVGWQVWLFGSENDLLSAEKIQALTNHQCENLIGQTNLSEAVDLLSLANYVVTNDSGLMHIAAALHRPMTAIYGSTSPDFTPPLSDRAKIVKLNLACQPCFKRTCPLKHHDCMRKILPEQI